MNTTKTTYLILFLLTTLITSAQVTLNTPLTKSPSVLLDFKQDPSNTSGMTLPIVDGVNTDMVAGTILFDKSDNRIKFKRKINATNSEWVSLSYVEGNLESHIENTSTDLGIGVYIGTNINYSIPGALVLESTNKAMVLPHVSDPMKNVKNPYPGMICYDPKYKAMFLFDGRYWNIWKKDSEI